jgi:excinuclease ABC subunit C
LDVLRRIFPYLTCDRVITGEDHRACLYFDIKLCTGPCIGAVDKETYRSMIQDLCRFLEGHTGPIVERLEENMQQASEDLEFERAAAIRDQLAAIEKVVEGQKVVSQQKIDSDVIAFAREQGDACVQVFFIRAGRLIGREYFVLEGTDEAEESEILESFLKQFYGKTPYVPARVMLPREIEEARIIESWLTSRRKGQAKVQISVPRRGRNRDLIELAAENAADTLSMLRSRWELDRSKQVQALAQLQEALSLAEPPNRIECYDISNLQGTAAAGSMVVFEQGVPSKRLYRKFNIKSVEGQDDFASMEEVLRRRFRRWAIAQEEMEKPGAKLDQGFGLLPDLLVVDGGKGQLTRAVEVLAEFNLSEQIPVAALAKAHEELYLPGKPDPVILPRRTQGLFLVQRLRDEAHRFAVGQHRSRRRRSTLSSKLDSVQGIGPARRKALLTTFGDVDGLRKAELSELAAIPGISLELAERVKAAL